MPEWRASVEGSGWPGEEGTGCLRGGLVNGSTTTGEAIACLAPVNDRLCTIACLVRVSSGTGKQPRGWATLMGTTSIAPDGSRASGKAGEEVAAAAAAVSVSAAGTAADVGAALGGALLSGAALAAPIAEA